MALSPMTFEEFQRTRREVADVGAAVGFDDNAVAGFVYNDSCYIEFNTGGDAASRNLGKYFLCLEASSFISDDLADLERKLFDWYVDINGPPQ